jgi:adenine-specific DNA-methyltransferase
LIDGPPNGRYWAISEERFWELDRDNRIWWGEDGNNIPAPKTFLSEVRDGRVPQTFWDWSEVGHTQDAKKTLIEMSLLRGEEATITPKPVALIERVLEIGASSDSLILDSFAGSGTTAHAVLKANARDGGRRKFILVEGEDYADRLTAERVRRAIKGYAWSGTQRETLLEEKITFSQFKKAEEWLAKVEAIKAREGLAEGAPSPARRGTEGEGAGGEVAQASLAWDGTPSPPPSPGGEGGEIPVAPPAVPRRRFDKIEVKIDEGVLRVEGVRRVSQMADGLGGEFTYCSLGEAVELDKLLSGERLPAFEALGAWLFYTATGGTLPPVPKKAPAWYLGEAKDKHVWLIYRPELTFLKSPEAALTLLVAGEFHRWGLDYDAKRGAPKGHLVFAPAKYLSNRQLKDHGIDYAPLPFALYREA